MGGEGDGMETVKVEHKTKVRHKNKAETPDLALGEVVATAIATHCDTCNGPLGVRM
jgi:hypothetical protein